METVAMKGNSMIVQRVAIYEDKIFVGSLARETNAKQLADHFQHFGIVKEAKVILDSAGNSKGYGFVSFAEKEVAYNVMQLGTIYLNNKKLIIGPAVQRRAPDYTLPYEQVLHSPSHMQIAQGQFINH